MYKKPWSIFVCDFVCWIPLSAGHRFKWVNSCFEVCLNCDFWTHNILILSSVTFWLLRCPLNRGETRVWTQKKWPFPLNRGFPSIEVTNTEIMWTFFGDQIFCPPNGGVTWIEVSQRRGSTVICQKWYVNRVRDRTLGQSLPVRRVTECSGKNK